MSGRERSKSVRVQARERILTELGDNWRTSKDVRDALGAFTTLAPWGVGVTAELSYGSCKTLLHEMAREGLIEKKSLGRGWKWRLPERTP